MQSLIQATLARSRTVLLSFIIIFITGISSYITIPKESAPDVTIPQVYVSVHHEGISAQDSERLLVKPLEKHLRTVEGVKEISATAAESNATLMLEFDAGFDSDQALTDVREKVDLAKVELPNDSDEPFIKEINVALFPVIKVNLSGDLPERLLVKIAEQFQDQIESVSGVLEAVIAGKKDELVELVIDPDRMEGYQLSPGQIYQFVSRNNQLVAAGAIDSGSGRLTVKIPGVFEGIDDILNMPIKVDGDQVVRFRDIAVGQRTFKDPLLFARVNGKSSLTLEVKKRIGANVIQTIDQVKAVVEKSRRLWPEALKVSYSQDQSEDIRKMLADLENSVLFAVILVMIVVISALGIRSALLVGIAIPGSFLMGILVISALGLTINMVVLFSLIMSVGMLVDGAIVVVELADRKMAEGYSKKEAFRIASIRMAWPIIASTMTTLAAFAPLLFWTGVMGEFMKYLPITLIATLSASLVMALIFVPSLGAIFAKRAAHSEQVNANLTMAESGDIFAIKGVTGWYIKVLNASLKRPLLVLLAVVIILIGSIFFYGMFGKGVEFFPEVEPENAIVRIHARGDLSVYERDSLVENVENRILNIDGLKTIYSNSGILQNVQSATEDTVGIIQIEFTDWETRKPASQILEEIKYKTVDIPGIKIDVEKVKEGPNQGKPIQLEVSSPDMRLLENAIEHLHKGFSIVEGLDDISDTRAIPGIEWQVIVDRAKASIFGADIATIGSTVRLITNGVNVGKYRPDNSDDEIDIRLRFPFADRNLSQLRNLRIPTAVGVAPIGNFIKLNADDRVSTINRVDSKRVLKIEANVAEGYNVAKTLKNIQAWLKDNPLDERVSLKFRGENEEQQKSMKFLEKAFFAALFMIAIILVTQFNSIYQAFLILTAVIFSIIGVLLSLIIFQQPFGIIMSGIGVISLAGIVVNNNIVLIDTYNSLVNEGMSPIESALRTGAQRLRPVLLTTITTILGLMPMVFGVNINLLTAPPDVTIGAPSAQWWTQLALAVAGGLTFATVLTLILTPALLVLGKRKIIAKAE
ncbi:MAG: efflux RND transporter permease subunit [Gammaproteobacteria bacterium]|nr:MAG: efflux RND transporter permease subunit [Gammaproteobacteria bacterium]